MKQDEHATIIRILDGDEQAYGILIDRYKEGLYRHCFRFLRDEDAAEDAAQQTFIKAYLQLEKFDRIHAFSTWLYKIATNVSLNELRRHRAIPMDEQFLETIVSKLPGTEKAAVYVELHEAIERLPDKQKAVVKLHYFEGRQYEQIAERLNTTTGTVKGWMHRAKVRLKEMLS